MSVYELLDKDAQAILDGMGEAELRSFAGALRGDEQPETSLSYAACHELLRLTKLDGDLDGVVGVAEPLLWSMAKETPAFVPLAEETSALLRTRFERTLSFRDLEGALYWMQEAHTATHCESERVPGQLEMIADLSDRVHGWNRLTAIEDAVSLEQLPTAVVQDPTLSLDDNIEMHTEMLMRGDVSSKQRLILANSVSRICKKAFGDSQVENEYLIRGVQTAEMAMGTASRLYAPRATRRLAMVSTHFSLGKLLAIQHEVRHDHDAERLRLAIHHLDAAEDLPDPMWRWLRMESLSGLWYDQFAETGDADFLARAVKYARASVQLIEEDEDSEATARADLRHKYGSKLLGLFDLNHEIPLLDEVEAQVKAGLSFVFAANLFWVRLKELHAAVFLRRFELVERNSRFIEQGIACCNEAVDCAPAAVLARTFVWDRLAGLLRCRYDLLEVPQDIVDAVNAATQAVDVLPPLHILRGTNLSNLAAMLWRKYDRLRDVDDLHRAIACAEQAKAFALKGSIHRGELLTVLSGLLTSRHELTKNVADLDEAVVVAEEAVQQTAEDDGQHLMMRHNLGRVLVLRAEAGEGTVNDTPQHCMTRALDIFRSVCREAPSDDATRAQRLLNLGHLLMRYRKSYGGDDQDALADEAVTAFDAASRCEYGAPSTRINAAIRAAEECLSRQRADRRVADADRLLRHAVSLLRHVSPRVLQQRDQEHILRRFSGLATLAAAVALEAKSPAPSAAKVADAEDALRLLEEGRGIILGLLFEVRSDVAGLQRQHPELAASFVRLRDALDAPDEDVFKPLAPPRSSPPPSSSSLTRRTQLTRELDETVSRIRRQPGFHSFLEPPDVAEMRRAALPVGVAGASGTVVVVNVSPLRCDAFVVSADGPVRQVALPDLRADAIPRWTALVRNTASASADDFFEMLAWLWTAIVSPVLLAFIEKDEPLQPREDDLPRIWWVLTGSLGALPIHAAGPYRRSGQLEQAGSASERYWTRVVSAYSPSIKALLFTRRNMAREDAEDEGTTTAVLHRAAPLLVSMGQTPGLSNLAFAPREVEVVRACLTHPDGPPPMVLHEPDKAAVLAGLRAGAPILHFAGHGSSDAADPLQSALLVRDWQTNRLTVGDLQALRLHEQHMPFLAYLSACSTGANHADDLVDEGLHLMSACQLAGFRHVVGSLWPVADDCCLAIAHAVLTAVVHARDARADVDTALALGLQAGVARLRDHRAADPTSRSAYAPSAGGRAHARADPRLWAGYIRIGP